MKRITPLAYVGATSALLLTIGCGSSMTVNNPIQNAQQTGTVSAIVSDSPTEDWATIGVKVLSISLVPQGGGTPVSVYTAPSTPPMINLVQLDQLGEILGNNATIPTGTYSGLNVTLGANNDDTNCDVELVASGDPEAGFDVPAGTTVPCSQIVITGAQGTAPNVTVPLKLTLDSPLSVTANSSNALDLEFDLRHPAFIVEHDPVGAAVPTWVVNFNGPVHRRPHPDLSKLLLRHTYGQVASVKSDNTSITINRAFPVHPLTNPETAIVDTGSSVTILADAANGTLFLDLDNSNSPSTIMNFSTVASELPNLYVRIAARYQQDGTLVATRILASSSFDKVWQNPEGHVLHVNTTNNVMWVTTEDGGAKRLAIGPNTTFLFGTSNTIIGTGTSFFDGTTPGGLPNVARGFKVTVTGDPLSTTTPPVLLSVEIDGAHYDGTITSPTGTQFDYARDFDMADGRGGKDDYTGSIDYAMGSEVDQQGAPVTGFYWWNFEFPTLEDTGANAVSDFEKAASGMTNFGGVVGSLRTVGASDATWNDPAASNTWSAMYTVLTPVGAPIGAISTAFSSGSDSFAFTVPLPKNPPANTPAAMPVTVDLDVTSGSATLVYQIDRQGGVITVTPQDISNPTTLATVGQNLAVGTPVKVFGVPQADGSEKAYVLFYYTHTASAK
jgi:hypothetical protein